jgi:hypothetical protein
MPTLTISSEIVARLSARDHTTYETDIDGTITDEQAAIEGRIIPARLASATYTTVLTLGVAKVIAARFLARLQRTSGMMASFQGGGVTMGKPRDEASLLEAEGWAELAPHLSRAAVAQITPDQTSPVGQAAQETLYGQSEGERARDVAETEDSW